MDYKLHDIQRYPRLINLWEEILSQFIHLHKLFGNCVAPREAEHLGGSINEVLHEGLV